MWHMADWGRIRIYCAAATAAALTALGAPGTVSAGTSIGQAQDGATCSGGTGMDTVQTAAAGPSYAVPSGSWVITDWSTQAHSTVAGNLALEVWRADPTTAGSFDLVGISPAQTVPAGSGLNTFTLAQPIAVQPGDLLGLRVVDMAGCSLFTLNFTGDAYALAFNPSAPAPGAATPFPSTVHGFQLNVAATLTAAAPPPPPTPSTIDDCLNGGWQSLADTQGNPFVNQGDCVSFVASGGRNPGRG